MRILMLTTAAGPAGVWPAGSVQDLLEEQALSLLGGGYAEAIPVALAPAPEPEAEPVAEAPEPPKPKARTRGRR